MFPPHISSLISSLSAFVSPFLTFLSILTCSSLFIHLVLLYIPSFPLLSPSTAFCCHESGATVLAMAPRQQLLITGGRKGWISVLELSHRHQRQSFQAHDSPVKALAVDPTEDCFISGSSEGNIKVFWLTSLSSCCILKLINAIKCGRLFSLNLLESVRIESHEGFERYV